MTEENKTKLIKRLKSLSWRLGIMLSLSILDFITTNLGLFNLSITTIAIATIFIGELTKWLNSKKLIK